MLFVFCDERYPHPLPKGVLVGGLVSDFLFAIYLELVI